MSILVLSTGGTIGSLPYEDPIHAPEHSSFPKDRDFVREALEEPPLKSASVRYVALEQRDSKFIDEVYLENLVATVTASPESKILITHGTDGILRSAEFLHRQRQDVSALQNKAIIITGAMIPLSNGPQSDGHLNLGFSLASLEDKKLYITPGIYIVLCDYDVPENERGKWQPRLYSYQSDAYEKLYSADSRYNRIRRRA